MHEDLFTLFPRLLERHVPKLTIRGDRARGCCPFHGGSNTSAFSADLRLGAWACWNCHKHGNIIAFARLVGVSLPHHALQPLPTAQQMRRSLAATIKEEYETWKTERYGEVVRQIAEHQSVIATLERLHERQVVFAEDELVLIGLHIAEQYDDIAQLTEEMDCYSPNPLIDDANAQRDWLETAHP